MMGFIMLPNTLACFFDVFPSLLFSGPVTLRDVVSFVRVFGCMGARLRELRLLALPDVCKRPWSLREPREMAMARASLVRSLLAWLHARVSFKLERVFNVIAHVRDWDHAETVRRRCPSGQLEALRSEWSARAQCDMWVNQHQSRDPQAQRG